MDDKTNKNLQEAGLKATLPRIKILEIMQRTAGTEDHYTAEDIYKELVMNSYDIGLATVYRVLTQFENAGMVVNHMVCVETGAITEFHDETIKKKQREIAEKHGYDLLDQSVILYVRKKKN
jgi:Fur family ferric uptake transcriptional regulator